MVGARPVSRTSSRPRLSSGANTAIYNHYTSSEISSRNHSRYRAVVRPSSRGTKSPLVLLDPVAQKLFQYVPPAGNYFVDSNGYLDNYVTYRYVSDNETRYSMRIDEVLSDKDHIYFRMNKIPEIGIRGLDANYPINGDGGTYSDSQQYMQRTIPALSLRLYSTIFGLPILAGITAMPTSPAFDVNSGQNVNTQLGLPSLTHGGIPMFSFGLDSFGNIGSQGSTLSENVEQQYEIADTVYLSRGAMTWKFGADLNKDMLNTLAITQSQAGIILSPERKPIRPVLPAASGGVRRCELSSGRA